MESKVSRSGSDEALLPCIWAELISSFLELSLHGWLFFVVVVVE